MADESRGSEHYKGFAIEPIEFIMKNKLPFPEGSIVKYVCRYKQSGKAKEDLEKAKHYIDMLIEELNVEKDA